MKKYYQTIIIAILIYCSLALDRKPLFAMKCVAKSLPFDEERSQASAIFTGKVINEENKLGYVVFQVYKVWKGSPSKTIEIPADDCTPNIFKMNNEYLVYAEIGVDSDGKKYLRNNLGSRTRLIAKAGADLDMLGVGKALSMNDTLKQTESSSANPISTKPSLSNNTNDKVLPSSKESISSQSSFLFMIASMTGGITSVIVFYMLKSSNSKTK
jgi:hypothetical protein